MLIDISMVTSVTWGLMGVLFNRIEALRRSCRRWAWPAGPKRFEVPFLGFLGFPPFALGCASLWHRFDEKWKSAGTALRLSAALGLALFSLAVFSAIDVYTVKKFVSLW